MRTWFADQRTQGVAQHAGHLAAGDIVLRTEAAVGIAADQTASGNILNKTLAPAAEGTAVGKFRNFARGLFHAQAVRQ